MTPDEQKIILAEVAAGRVDRFGEIVEAYSRRIHALIAGIVGDGDQADELTQDTFVRAFTSLDSFRRSSNIATWLYRIAYNLAITHTRRRATDAISFSALAPAPDDADVGSLLDRIPSPDKEPDPRLALLPRALDMLPPDDKAILTLFYYEELPVADIARITGLTLSNVKVRMHRSRQRLYQIINSLDRL